MRFTGVLVFLIQGCLIALLVLIPLAHTAYSATFERHFLMAAQRGDFSRLEEALTAFPEEARSLSENELYLQYRERFVARVESFSPHTGVPLLDSLVAAHRSYWVQAAMHPDQQEELELELRNEIREILNPYPEPGGPESDLDIYERMVRAVRPHGFHLLSDWSPPFRDLIVWQAEEREEYQVALTDGNEPVTVVFMSDFVSQGWSHFLSLSLLSTSGWAGEDALYCVSWAYDRDSPEFHVSYLQHEARHLADYRLYPGLAEEELEYRAKLTELAFAGTTATTLLAAFTADADGSGPGAHARANSRVARDMYREIFGGDLPAETVRWDVSPAFDVNPAARVLLERSSAGLVVE